MNKKKNIWHFPTWYPHQHNLSLGSFAKKQIEAAALFSQQVVFFVYENSSLKNDFELTLFEDKNLIEVFVSFSPATTKFGTLRKKKKAYQLAIQKIENKSIIPDFIHAHSISFASFVAKKMASKYDVNWYLSEHWSGFLPASREFEKMPFYKRKIWIIHAQKCKAIVCVSQTLKLGMIQNGLKHPNYKIIPNVVDGKWVESSNLLEKKTNKSSFVFLNVSDMVDDIKNISGVIRSFDRVWKNNNSVRLWLVGEGKDLTRIKDFSSKLAAHAAIQFFGRLSPDEVLEFYPKVDATVINSRYETFSVVAAESLFAGKPIITTRCGGPEEFVTNKQGIFIDVDDDNELQKAMETLVVSAKKYDAATLHNSISNQFSKEIIAKKLQDLYQ